jgi:hypothetical protein
MFVPKLSQSALPGRWSSSLSPARRAASVEPLEPRWCLSVSLDAQGYTVITPEAGDRTIYVSSSAGNDSRDGTSPQRALRTLAAGVDRLRDGTGDRLLLKRGDTWNTPLPAWKKSGASADRPMVVGAYGDGSRPVIATRGASAFVSGVSSGRRVDHLYLIGLELTASARDPDSPDFDASLVGRTGIGLQFFAGGSDILIEDCRVSHFTTNVALQDGMGSLANVRLRRNVIVDAYASPSVHSQGLFADGVNGLLLEGNVFDHNGWSSRVGGAPATVFNHNAYLSVRNESVRVIGNLFANAASHGLQARAGGDVLDNLFVANPLHMSFGLVRGDSPPRAGGVSGIINGNVFLGTRDINGQQRGFGLEIANTASDRATIVSNNVFSNEGDNGVPWQAGGFAAISLAVGSGRDDATLAAGLRNLRIDGNIIRRWAKGISFQNDLRAGGKGSTGYDGLVVRRNELSRLTAGPAIEHLMAFDPAHERWVGNRFGDDADGRPASVRVAGRSLSPQAWVDDFASDDRPGTPAYREAGRSLSGYAKSAGGMAAVDAITWARSLSPSANRNVMANAIAYVRNGFANADADAPPRNWLPPTPPAATAEMPVIVRTDESFITATITYRDDEAVNAETVVSSAVHLVGRSGRRLDAVDVQTRSADGGRTIVAEYRFASPATVWRRKDRGSYRVVHEPDVVKDTSGFAVDGGTLLSATVEVEQVPPPPAVRKVKFLRGKRELPDRLTIQFTQDLAVPPTSADLRLVGVDAVAVPAGTAMEYDSARRLATFTFPQYANGQLPAGNFTLSLAAATLQSPDGKPLDGNADGLAGDDYLLAKPLKVRR